MLIPDGDLQYHLVMQIMRGRMLMSYWRAYRGGELVSDFWVWDPADPPPTAEPANNNDFEERVAA
jgi:hypothetical protein